MIESVDSVKTANEIGKQSLNLNKTTDVLVEINIGSEISKSGIDKSMLYEFIDELSQIKFSSRHPSLYFTYSAT